MGIDHMHRAGDTRIKGVDGAQKFERPGRIGHRRGQQGSFVRATLPLRVSRAGIPRGWNYCLIILDGLAADFDPVAQGTARGLMPPVSARRTRPGAGIPTNGIEHGNFAVRHVRIEFIHPRLQTPHHQLRFEGARGNPPQRRKQDRGRRIQLFQYAVHQLADVFLARGITHHHARQRSHFHRFAVVARRLQPRIFLSTSRKS